jgi:hypothetical protein
MDKTFISRHISSTNTCPIALPALKNPQYWSLLTVASATSVLNPSSSAKRFSRYSTQLWTTLRDKHFPPQTGNISLWISFALSHFSHRETHNRTPLFSTTLLKRGRHFDYWNQPLNMCMRAYYLGGNAAGLCSYLAIHIETLLHPLQLFYFQLWPIYWLSFIFSEQSLEVQRSSWHFVTCFWYWEGLLALPKSVLDLLLSVHDSLFWKPQ